MTDVQLKRRGRPPKVRVEPQVEAVPVPAETAPESADVDRGEGDSWEGWQEVADRNVEVIEPQDDTDAAHMAAMLTPIALELSQVAQPDGKWVPSPAQIAALDHDHNGEAGGSLPKASLTDLQVRAFAQDARDAYEGHGPIVREDGFYRIWRFQQETIKDHAHMALSAKRGPIEHGRHILMSQFMVVDVEAILRELDAETSR